MDDSDALSQYDAIEEEKEILLDEEDFSEYKVSRAFSLSVFVISSIGVSFIIAI